jgi:hypothetical protein
VNTCKNLSDVSAFRKNRIGEINTLINILINTLINILNKFLPAFFVTLKRFRYILVLKLVQNIADHMSGFENQVSEIYALHNDINENLSLRIFYKFHLIWTKRYRICLQNRPRFSEFRENGRSGSHISIRAITNFYTCRPHSFSDFY